MVVVNDLKNIFAKFQPPELIYVGDMAKKPQKITFFHIHGDSNKVLQQVFSFIIGDTFFAFYKYKLHLLKSLIVIIFCRKSVPCTVGVGSKF